MNMTAKRAKSAQRDPEQQLAEFVAKFEPKLQTLIRSVRKAVRTRLPSAHELVYDNYNFFVIGYSPTLRPSDAIVSVTADANGVGLCFIHGAKLDDPNKILSGDGKQTRFLRLDSSKTLALPDVEALIAAAIDQSAQPLATSGRGTLVIRSVSVKQRPRRKPAK
ncbi:MAG: DUF1801 domain-containing protein [bacterium]